MHRALALFFGLLIGLIFSINSVYAGSCTRILQKNSTEYIFNACDACRKVNIQRKRRSIAMPVMRTYNIQPRSKFPTSFRGIGRSRITSEIPCEGTKGASVNITDPHTKHRQQKICINLQALGLKGVVLVNKCSRCQGVVIQRISINGNSMGQQIYKMKPLSVISVRSKGAAQVRYVTEAPCPS